MRRPDATARFLLAYALANAAGVIAYTPLLTLLLPARMAQLAGATRMEWLGAATLAGALTASGANLLFGWLSDRAGSRRGWTAGGLAATLASYALIGAARTPLALVLAVVVFQAAVNLFLAPLAAWAADTVPDRRKGVLSGLLGAAPPVAALAGIVATLPGLGGEPARLVVVGAIIAALALPLLLDRSPPPATTRERPAAATRRAVARRNFALLWCARLLVQVAAVVLFGFLLFYFQALPDAPDQPWVARLIALALALGLPLTLLVGRWSDRLGPRRPFLAAATAAMATGLALMAHADARLPATVGYIVFGCGLSVFLPLQATFAMQLLPRPDRHGRDLGVLNLANTVPSVIATLLAAGLVPRYGFAALLWTLTAAALLAGGCVLAVRCDRQSA